MEAVLPRLRGYFKILIALSIPVGIASFFVYSQKQADIEVNKYKDDQQKNPNTDRVTVTNYALKEVDDSNHIRWQLLADKGIMKPDTKDVDLVAVKVEYFDEQKLKMRISSPVGITNEKTHYVRLDSKNGQRVTAEGGDDGAKLEASTIELKEKNKFVATGGVNILWPGVAKVTGNSANGVLQKGADLKNVKIVGNTHALVGHI